jgi:excisionase family DNA binding protein
MYVSGERSIQVASERDVLTAKEVSEILRIHLGTFYRLVREGKFQGFRVGSEWRFRKDELERWMAEQTKRSRGPRGRPTKK